MDKRNVLSISPLYFEITSGLGKWLYRASRKHAGGNGADGFTIGFETLHQKSGSESSLPSFKNKIMELARANSLPEISLAVIGEETPRPKLKMVMRRFIQDESESGAHRRKACSPALINQTAAQRSADDNEVVDPGLARGLIAKAAAGLKARDLRPSADTHGGSYAEPARVVYKPRTRAQSVLDPEVYQAIKTECPGWDLDVLMKTFDAFLNANPNELPRNYSQRFFGFVKKHHERNKFQLQGI